MSVSPILPVYRRADITMVRGEGCYLFDASGKRYLDFATGIAVNALGHCHPHVSQALKSQADTLWHCSNLYYHPGIVKLAERLVANSFADTVFFCSSGTEAIECAVKMTRRYQYTLGNAHKYRIITFDGGFHGRSFAGISAGGNESAREGYAPLLDGFDRVAFNNIEAVSAAITEATAGILIEPIQGEGGIRTADDTFLQALRALADEYGLLLMFDEVQCGMGRSGRLFAYEYAGIEPDIATVAKGIGNGFPLAACLATERAGSGMTPGSHGSTYGANPLAMAAGNAVLDVMLEPDFLPHVVEMGGYLHDALHALTLEHPATIREIRGRGLMLGMKVNGSHYELAAALRQAGLLTAPSVNDHVIRILPPLIVDKTHIDEAVSILSTLLQDRT